ncbi:unnamed protein product [Prunus brigantina]
MNSPPAGTYKDAHAPIQRINRWRQAKIVLCASRRFWQILYLKKELLEKQNPSTSCHESLPQMITKMNFRRMNIPQRRTSTNGDFGIGREELDALTKNDDVGCLEQYGGAMFSEQTHITPEKSTSFLTCLWDACHQDISLIIFIVVAVASSVMGLVTKVTRFGYWEEGGNVAVVVMVNIIVRAICKYSQSLIHNVKEEGRNMDLKVTSVGICTKSELSQEIGNKTTFKEVLNAVATCIVNVGLAVAFIAMMVLLLRWFTGHNLDGSPKFIGVKTKPRDVIEEVNQIIIIAFTIAVAAVPQGLPLAVTLIIVSATKKMVADNAFVCEIAYYFAFYAAFSFSEAFKWGQSVHANIIKLMQLQLTVNVVTLTTNFKAAVFYGYVPLNAVQLLWVNQLIVALVPLSLVTKPPTYELMPGLLVEPGQPLKRYVKWKRLVFQGVYQIVAILIINFQGWSLLKSYTSGHAIKVKNTMIFNTFVVCQIIHQMEARKKDILSKPKMWITSNYLFMGIAGTVLISPFIIIEFLGKAFSTVALNQKEWQFSLTLGFVE